MYRKLIALFALLLLSVACARVAGPRAGGGDSSDPESPVASSPGDPGDPGPSPSPRIVEPRDGLTGVHPSAFDKSVVVDETHLRVEYYLGVEECYGLDRVDVEYGEEVVIITLYTGSLPGERACIDIAEFVATNITLDEPLNGRKIVDGSAEGGTPDQDSGYDSGY